jgi:hypothetical protein
MPFKQQSKSLKFNKLQRPINLTFMKKNDLFATMKNNYIALLLGLVVILMDTLYFNKIYEESYMVNKTN